MKLSKQLLIHFVSTEKVWVSVLETFKICYVPTWWWECVEIWHHEPILCCIDKVWSVQLKVLTSTANPSIPVINPFCTQLENMTNCMNLLSVLHLINMNLIKCVCVKVRSFSYGEVVVSIHMTGTERSTLLASVLLSGYLHYRWYPALWLIHKMYKSWTLLTG